jgi:hypothetical protein
MVEHYLKFVPIWGMQESLLGAIQAFGIIKSVESAQIFWVCCLD